MCEVLTQDTGKGVDLEYLEAQCGCGIDSVWEWEAAGVCGKKQTQKRTDANIS